MYGTVKIGNTEIDMAANAASPYVYKSIFHEDFLVEIQKENASADIFQKMGFVMAQQAKESKISELMKINETAFYEWLSEFEPMAVLEAAGEISNLYMGQTNKTSSPKKKGG